MNALSFEPSEAGPFSLHAPEALRPSARGSDPLAPWQAFPGQGFGLAWALSLATERAKAREVERLAALEIERAQFIEQIARAWHDSREFDDGELIEERQQALISQVEAAADRFGCDFDDIAGPANARANEIKEERVQALELKRELSRGISDGWER